MSIKQNLEAIISTIPSNSTLIAVSKQQSMPSILEAYDSGIRLFGENKIGRASCRERVLRLV